MPDNVPVQILCVRVNGSKDAVREWLSRHPSETYAAREDDRGVSVELFLPSGLVEQIDRKQLHVEVVYDASKRGRERQKEVGKGNRFERGDARLFKGLGEKTKGEPK